MRESVKEFADAMERVLKDNDHKDGWKNLNAYHLLGRIDEERDELFRAMDRFYRDENAIGNQKLAKKDLNDMLDEAIDIANFCMMLYDNYKERGK